jgi:hypothetical protein
MVAMVAWLPLAEHQGLQHVRGVQKYVTEHLITVPANSPFSVSRESFDDGRQGHRVDFPNQEYCWAFFAQHDGGRWRFQGTGGILFLFGPLPRIGSAAEARDHLVRHGVPAGNLGINLEASLPMNEEYAIDAPFIGGRYGVETNGQVRLYFETPARCPE